MAISVLSKTAPRPLLGGQEGAYEQTIYCAWSTSDTTGTVPIGLAKRVFYKGFTVLNASAIANDLVAFAGTVNADGTLVLGTGGTVSLMRPAGTTSACKFSVTFEGYP